MAEQGTQCVFCQIISGESNSRKIYEDEGVIAILDIKPRLAPGQCLVIPKKHVEQFYDLDDDEVADLFKAVKVVAKKMTRVFAPPRFRICTLTSGRTVPHAHVFLFPSSEDGVLDKFFETSSALAATIKESSDDKLDLMAQKIKEASPIEDVNRAD